MGLSEAEIEDAGLADRLRGESGDVEVPELFQFEVDVRPVGKQRPRAGANGTFYTPTKTAEFEEYVAAQAKMARPKGWPLDERYQVKMVVKYDGKQHADLDNVVKAFLDGLNGICYNDDSQVHRQSAALELDMAESSILAEVKRI